MLKVLAVSAAQLPTPPAASVAGAKVTATNDATGVASHAVTSSAGTYNITDLIPGVYSVKVEFTGFAISVQRNVHVDVSRDFQH